MSDPAPFVFPEICEDDISWACHMMGLPDSAFDKARKAVLFSHESLDVAACPGSGKTTLLVAKLAIMARKWTDRRRGICVLSHTNAAREVIKDRLGATAEGKTLLSYPHFVGTIHGFVDRFLGIPYSRFSGWDVHVDDEECFAKIEKCCFYVRSFDRAFKNAYTTLNHRNNGKFYKLKFSYSNGHIDVAPKCDKNHLKLFPQMTRQEDINTFQMCLKMMITESGIHAYDDMFVFGHSLIDLYPAVRHSILERFPVLFIDEAQDNSELQSAILHRVFVNGVANTVCQRFGDANQAIYHSISSQDAPTTWVFPNQDIKCDVPDSHRFGPAIAQFSLPLCVEPQEVRGLGPDQRKVAANVDKKHTIFLFDEQARAHVLPVYARYLRETFDKSALERGDFVALGAVHKKPDDDDHKPRSVCDYWGGYAPEQTKTDPRPKTFVGYVQAGRAKAGTAVGGNLHLVVEKIASGVLEAIRLAGGKPANRQRKSRYIREALTENATVLGNYDEFVRRFAVDNEHLTQDLWEGEWREKISGIVETLLGGSGGYRQPEDFLGWPEDKVIGVDGAKAATVYQEGEDGSPEALPKIRVGSIHSVKGETHTSTLVLETFRGTHNLKAIKEWLLGKPGTQKQRDEKSTRLKVHYVALTRPTHLLCLALPDGTFTEPEIATLEQIGWRVSMIDKDGHVALHRAEEA